MGSILIRDAQFRKLFPKVFGARVPEECAKLPVTTPSAL